ncbi:hypothetical protein HPB50_013275 [Hyalomma asiaticum]|uniref:Uncharacterized protein n=1 Tax=Hyalomma asiaticum TaxID=266040 RepID=A0ACB7T6P8_HYAAI|nr:hypothetical protein HPB50_013275 [Hyalomma asiaticum]
MDQQHRRLESGVVLAEAGRPPGTCPVLRETGLLLPAECRRRRRGSLLRPPCVLGRDDFGTCRDDKFSGVGEAGSPPRL